MKNIFIFILMLVSTINGNEGPLHIQNLLKDGKKVIVNLFKFKSPVNIPPIEDES